MMKECKVLSYNKFLNILVFDYNGKPIQTTAALSEGQNSVFVQYDEGKYAIVGENEYKKFISDSTKEKEPARLVRKEKVLQTKDVLK